jgi:tetratricopeptide (TPR) repeat protein
VEAGGQLREQSRLLLCEAFYQLKQWNDVVAIGLELLRSQPDHAEAHRWLGATYFDLGDLTQAEFHLKELARLAPKDYSPHRLLGVIHKDFERYKEAIADFRQALERGPPTSIAGEIRLDLAKSLVQQNLFEDALQSLNFQWPSNSIGPHVLAAECHWALNNRDLAKQELENARKLAADDPQVLWMSVRIALDEEQTVEALELLQQVVQAEPTNHQALYEISLAYRRLGKEAESQEFLDRRNAARALFEQLVELNKQAIKEPLNADIRLELASLCDQLGKKELAAVWRDAAAALKTGQNRR